MVSKGTLQTAIATYEHCIAKHPEQSWSETPSISQPGTRPITAQRGTCRRAGPATNKQVLYSNKCLCVAHSNACGFSTSILWAILCLVVQGLQAQFILLCHIGGHRWNTESRQTQFSRLDCYLLALICQLEGSYLLRNGTLLDLWLVCFCDGGAALFFNVQVHARTKLKKKFVLFTKFCSFRSPEPSLADGYLRTTKTVPIAQFVACSFSARFFYDMCIVSLAARANYSDNGQLRRQQHIWAPSYGISRHGSSALRSRSC